MGTVAFSHILVSSAAAAKTILSQQWEQSFSVQMFPEAGFTKLIARISSTACVGSMGRFPFLFLSCTVLGAQLWFWPHLCICTTLMYLLPLQSRGSKSSSWLGHTYGRGYSSTTGICLKCLQWQESGKQLQQTVAHSFTFVGAPPTACRGRGWQVGAVTAPSFMIHSRIVPCFLSRPHFL